MTLASGTRLGPYEITGAIGAGGTGEVFRAVVADGPDRSPLTMVVRGVIG